MNKTGTRQRQVRVETRRKQGQDKVGGRVRREGGGGRRGGKGMVRDR